MLPPCLMAMTRQIAFHQATNSAPLSSPAEQIREFQPALVSIQDAGQREALQALIKDAPRQPEIVAGDAGILEVASHPDAAAVVTGIVGCAGLAPTCAAISKGKDICLANKETLIAGEAPLLSPCLH